MKKAFRTISILCVAAAMLFALASCGKTPTDDKKTDPNADAGKTDAVSYKIASDISFSPFEFKDLKTNSYTGIDMDLIKAISEDQGFNYEMSNVGFDAAVNNLKAGQADAVIAGMTINDERKKDFDFTDGYFTSGQIMVVAKDSPIKSLEDLKGKTVGTKAGTEGKKYADSKKDEYGFKTIVYDDSTTMYMAVTQGNDAACFEDSAVATYSIKSGDLALQTVGEEINPKDYGLAVRKGTYPELIEKFNKGLENLKTNGKYKEILAKYGIEA